MRLSRRLRDGGRRCCTPAEAFCSGVKGPVLDGRMIKLLCDIQQWRPQIYTAGTSSGSASVRRPPGRKYADACPAPRQGQNLTTVSVSPHHRRRSVLIRAEDLNAQPGCVAACEHVSTLTHQPARQLCRMYSTRIPQAAQQCTTVTGSFVSSQGCTGEATERCPVPARTRVADASVGGLVGLRLACQPRLDRCLQLAIASCQQVASRWRRWNR